ncbi:hypothetical protein ACWF82_03795 [Nocardia sp. NPDC055053]
MACLRSDASSFIGGGIGYVVIAILTITSFDRVIAQLGPTLWHRVQTAGS